MSASILTSVKKICSIAEADTIFDPDIIMHINSVFSTLKQFGIGPDDGYSIEDKTPTWDAFIGPNKAFNFVQSYVSMRVKLLFDPPTTSYLITAVKEQIAEFEWRISTEREQRDWVDPNPVIVTDDQIIDGGTP